MRRRAAEPDPAVTVLGHAFCELLSTMHKYALHQGHMELADDIEALTTRFLEILDLEIDLLKSEL